MSIRSQIMDMARRDPNYERAVDMIEDRLKDEPIDAKDLDETIDFLEFVLQHPDSYQEAIQAAIKDGILEDGFMPPQYNQTFIVSLLIALYGFQDKVSEKYAKGGLAQVANRLKRAGRYGDTMLAHISPKEAEMLKRHGGSGTTNPKTGLPEYFKPFKFLKEIAPIAISIFAPSLGQEIGEMLGASGIGANILGQAVIGGATSALTGGDILKGAGMGAISGGVGGILGEKAGSMLGINMSPMVQNIVGNALAGGALGSFTDKGFLPGLATGALGGAIQGAAGQYMQPGGMQTAGQTFGNALTAGFSPAQAAGGAALTGLARGMFPSLGSASDRAIAQAKGQAAESLDVPDMAKLQSPDMFNLSSGMGGLQQTVAGDLINPSLIGKAAGQMGGAAAGGLPWGKLALLGGVASMMNPKSNLSGASADVKQRVSALSPKQQEYFNRPMKVWDWGKMQRDADQKNQDLYDYMATNWNRIMGGEYDVKTAARGGLSEIARFAKGAGSGRDDTIDAKLSDGEYVVDAETVALLGDGSSEEGAKRLDMMREQIRKQKGKALAKGKFSPNARSPLAYLKGIQNG